MKQASELLILSITPFFFLILAGSSQAVFVSEFMPDPADNCSDCSEWLEIFISEPVEAESLMLETGKYQTIISISLSAGEYLLITRNASVFGEMWNTEGAKLLESKSMRLTNTGNNITLYKDLVAIQSIVYSGPDVNVSYGICADALVQQNVSTPGHENICASEPSNQTNETGADSCDVSIAIASEQFFNSGEKQNYLLLLKDESCVEKDVVIEYWIEDLFGEHIKAKHNSTTVMECDENISREWTPPATKGTEAYRIMAQLSVFGCNDTDASNNHADKIVVVGGEPLAKESSIKILEIDAGSDKKAKFGDVVDIVVNVYKGDTTKSSIDIWIENAAGTKIAKANLNVYEKFSNQTVTVPLQINPNCDGNYANGSYAIRIEGLDSQDYGELKIEGQATSLCKTKTIETSKPCSCPPCQACKCENKTACNVTSGKATGKNSNSDGAALKNYFLNNTEQAKDVEKTKDIPDKNGSKNDTRNGAAINLPTGKIISKTNDDWFSSALDSVINFFKNLFKL
ncbi:MAG: hypothetical protein NTU57_03750 [Candidatus Aenigmarchaeota archaeon]|nr:hypothetical protein [Candidatus Aenigmarchaeota archaeon]